MKTKHTPGPWTLNDDGFIRTEHTGDLICCDVENANDARLIASAPELLEWANAYLTFLEGLVPIHDQFFGKGSLDAHVTKLRTAIAKATGGAK